MGLNVRQELFFHFIPCIVLWLFFFLQFSVFSKFSKVKILVGQYYQPLEPDHPGSKPDSDIFQAVWHWISCLFSMWFSFLICKNRNDNNTYQIYLVWVFSELVDSSLHAVTTLSIRYSYILLLPSDNTFTCFRMSALYNIWQKMKLWVKMVSQ